MAQAAPTGAPASWGAVWMGRLGRELRQNVRFAARALLARPDPDRVEGMAAAVGLVDESDSDEISQGENEEGGRR